jgi:alpha-galactosidase
MASSLAATYTELICNVLSMVFSHCYVYIHRWSRPMFVNLRMRLLSSAGVAQTPYLGWSSFSQQTISSNFLTQANMVAQSDALLSSGLQSHGFNYLDMDSGWQGSFDANGRPIPNTAIFPDITALVAHIHGNGQKAGIYWIPGVEYPAGVANSPILGTPYHIQDILAVPYRAGNAFGGPGTSHTTTRSTSPSRVRRSTLTRS